MGMVRIAGFASIVLAAQVTLAQNTVSFTLGVGGDNHATDIKNKVWTYFTPGTTAEGTVVNVPPGDRIVTWYALLEATGTDAGFPIQGVANFVFDLELRSGDANGPLAPADFISTIHDASGSCADFDAVTAGDYTPLIGHCARDLVTGDANSNENICDPCFAAAGFAFSFKTNTGTSGTPARVIDQWYGNNCSSGLNPSGGPNLGVFLYPTCEPGRLYGMGAGYAQWVATGLRTQVKAGLGLASPTPAWNMPGIVPVVEGQIDFTGLPDGEYTLVLTPGTGINIVRGDINVGVSQPAFARAATTSVGDTITFIVSEAAITSNLVSAVSRRTHGAAGDFDVDILAVGAVEPRTGGVTRAVLGFDAPITLACGDISLVSGSCGNMTDLGGGTSWAFDIAGNAANACQQITITNATLTGSPVILEVADHRGNVNGDANVDVVDLSSVKGALFVPVSAANFTRDVDSSGQIDVVDLSTVKGNLFAPLAGCP